jgi:hypothetical protein
MLRKSPHPRGRLTEKRLKCMVEKLIHSHFGDLSRDVQPHSPA